MSEQEIYIEAMNRRDPVDRRRFLDEACGDNQALRERLDNLIRHSEEVGGFLESSPLEHFSAPTLDHPITENPGTQIGPYKLREQIGEGGFGLVFVAEQQKPVRRKVALKLKWTIKSACTSADELLWLQSPHTGDCCPPIAIHINWLP